jgi:hypothetical protein
MLSIRKYPVPIDHDFAIDLPAGATLLDLACQADRPYLWALVDPEAPVFVARFRLFGTGQPVPEADMRSLAHVGSFPMAGGSLVFHLFRVTEGPR